MEDREALLINDVRVPNNTPSGGITGTQITNYPNTSRVTSGYVGSALWSQSKAHEQETRKIWILLSVEMELEEMQISTANNSTTASKLAYWGRTHVHHTNHKYAERWLYWNLSYCEGETVDENFKTNDYNIDKI